MPTGNQIPKHWQVKKLVEICHINPKIPGHYIINEGSEVQFLPMKLVEELSGRTHLTETRRYGDVKKGYTPFVNGDILFAKVTPCMENGKIAVVDNLKNSVGFGSSEFHVIRPQKGTLNKYIFYFVVQDKFRHDAANAMTGAVGLRRVPKQFIENYSVPLPSFEEQQVIVCKIEELFSELDKGIEQLKIAQQQLKVYRQAVLKYAFEGKFTNHDLADEEIPKGWKKIEVREVAKIIGGYAFKSGDFQTSGKYQVLRMGNVRPGKIRFGESPVFLNVVEDNVLERSLLEPNDVIITLTGTRKKRDYGFTALLTHQNLLLNQRIAAIRFTDKYLPKFFLYFSWTEKFKDQFFANETGNVGQGNVGMKAITQTVIPHCSITEQRIVVQEIESRLSVCDKLEETISNSLNQAEALRQSIFKKAFEGKLLSETEVGHIRSVTYSNPEEQILKIAAEPKTRYKKKLKQPQVQFPKVIDGIKTTDLHAGILAMVIDAHEKSPKHYVKLSHVKGEKIAHLVEAHIGIDLGRVPKKDAAGPDDFPHLKKVEHRAKMANWFGTKKLEIGYTYSSKQGLQKVIARTKAILSGDDLIKIENLITTFLPFDLEESELRATLYAGWNNLLLEGENPSDEEIVYESRENWSKRKLGINRASFFKTLEWMKENGFIPEGKGKKVL